MQFDEPHECGIQRRDGSGQCLPVRRIRCQAEDYLFELDDGRLSLGFSQLALQLSLHVLGHQGVVLFTGPVPGFGLRFGPATPEQEKDQDERWRLAT